jgi:hypothetical protein
MKISVPVGLIRTYLLSRRGSKHITLHDDRVGIVTKRDIIIWTVGGGTQIITGDITPDGDSTKDSERLTPEAILFHPTSPATIVLLSSRKIKSTDPRHVFTLRLTAQEHTNRGLQQPCFFDVPFTSDNYQKEAQFDVGLIDNNGIYSVYWIFRGFTDLSNVSHACSYHKDGRSNYHLLSYDMYHQGFIMKCFDAGADDEGLEDGVQLHLPPDDFLRDTYVWADQMLTLVIDSGSTSCHFLFQSVTARHQVSKEFPSVRYISGIKDPVNTKPKKDLMISLKGQNEGLLFYFTYVVESMLDLEPWADWNWERKICGDETFLVLFAELGLVVLCSDKGVVLPSINQLAKEYLVYQSSN